MKNIFTIISSLLLIGGSVFLDTFLSDANTNVPIVTEQYTYKPVKAHTYNLKIESFPFNEDNTKNQVEGVHVANTRFAIVRKIILRHPCFAPLSVLNRHSTTVLTKLNKTHSNYIGFIDNNLPLHVRNCSWLI